ncbi:putative ATP-dependent RNA helicase DHX30 [Trichinella pseudospiralis]|uniref:Putative ATP-dependent RNA helicase DHX30 n=1 Tax=Trichinella pseudospiralis TaxID=6337 RepID=A0A0V1G4S0_TRIPS|nr:putative ATP-dependent RNA helicase DHX30 [Trichinella pseudospiralis]
MRMYWPVVSNLNKSLMFHQILGKNNISKMSSIKCSVKSTLERYGVEAAFAKNPKTVLLNFFQVMHWKMPSILTERIGLPHEAIWHCRISFVLPGSDNLLTFNSCIDSKSKSEAESWAAYSACKFLSEKYDHFPSKKKAIKAEKVKADELLESQKWSQLGRHPKSVVHEFYQARGFDKLPLENGKITVSLTAEVPVVFSTVITRNTRKHAAAVAYWEFLLQLKEAKYVDDNFHVIFHSKQEIMEFKKNQRLPTCIDISESLFRRIDCLVKEFRLFSNEFLQSVKRMRIKQAADKLVNSDGCSVNLNEEDDEDSSIDECLELDMILKRNHSLYTSAQRLRNSTDPAVINLRSFRQQLPIFVIKDELLSALENHQVVIIAGDTGCGKTTQIPQFIFDDYVTKFRGAECNIIVTQPRRISAIAMANRLATERHETLGETVGFNVRLNRCIPRNKGSILFLTPGTFLRSAMCSEKIENISHVIIDEVHERDVLTDLMLVFLKRKLVIFPNLKLILMSASINPYKFASYFNNCPVLSAAGRIFDVAEYFLDDVYRFLGREMPSEEVVDHDYETDANLVAELLFWIHKNRPVRFNNFNNYYPNESGDVLCFLPSWNDICRVGALLDAQKCSEEQMLVLPCHSSLPISEQKRIFEPVSCGTRKIVLATNIAETSLTIDNIRYVVNTGTRKIGRLIASKNWLSHHQSWASKSSQIQRKGRAGRQMEGECYHLFSKEVYKNMPEYDVPTIQAAPLERLVLMTKSLFENSDPFQVLSEALDPPSKQGLDAARKLLQDLKIFDKENRLTELGKNVALFGCHPFLGIALLYSVVDRCTEPILSLVACLESEENFFDLSISNKDQIMKVLEYLIGRSFSLHCSAVNLCRFSGDLMQQHYSETDEWKSNIFFKNFISLRSVVFILELRKQFAQEVVRSNLVDEWKDLFSLNHPLNLSSNNFEIIKAVITAGLFQNVAKGIHGNLSKRGKIEPDAVTICESNLKPVRPRRYGNYILKESDNWWSDWFVYYRKIWSEKSRTFAVEGLSMINPLIAVLFSGFTPEILHSENATVIALVPAKHFQLQVSSARNAELLIRLRSCIHDYFNLYIIHHEHIMKLAENDPIKKWHNDLLTLITDLLSVEQNYNPKQFTQQLQS